MAVTVTGHHLLHIDGYSYTKELAPSGRCIRSRSFRAAGRSWHITYYPNGILRKSADYIAVYLSLEHLAGAPAVQVHVRFSLLDQAGKPPVPVYTATASSLPYSSLWGSHQFITRACLEKSPHLVDDSFTIRCDISVSSDGTTRTEEDTVVATPPPSDLRRHLGAFLMAEDGADVTFQVAGELFKAHRCILAARSPVFKAELLGTVKKEGDPAAVVEVQDMEPEVFRALLEFLYTDAVPEMSRQEEDSTATICQRLLVAADRYGMERLKLICEARLREHIDTGTAATILALAEQHRCPGLKDACFRFLKTPGALAAVAASEGFEHLSRSCPSIFKEIIFRAIDG